MITLTDIAYVRSGVADLEAATRFATGIVGLELAERTEPSPGVVLADLDEGLQSRVRSELPVLANRRPDAYRWPGDDTRGGTGSGP